jgi:hypothetical protein
MAKKTIRARIVEALEKRGETLLEHRAKTDKWSYQATTGNDSGTGYLFLGKAGSLRIGRTLAVSTPYDRLKARLLEEAP